VVWKRYPYRSAGEEVRIDGLSFAENRRRLVSESQMLASNNDTHSRFFRLPDAVRFRIWKEVLRDHDSGKSVRLNNPGFLAAVWPVERIGGNRCQQPGTNWDNSGISRAQKEENRADRGQPAGYFDSLATVLDSVQPYMATSFGARIDVLATLMLTRRFHVVYSPFVSAQLQPAATLWLDKYARG
jgi:hypothetical protein